MSWRRVHRIVRRVWVVCGLAFSGWMVWSFQSHGVPSETLASDGAVTVEHLSGSWRFQPNGGRRAVGLIFLPGGMVAPKAYTPIAKALAREGYPVAIVELPLRMARTPEAEATVAARAREAISALDARVPWVLGGHSRGAAIATRLISAERAAYQGMVLVGTTHPKVDLSALEIPVLKIGGTRDCVAPRDRSEEASSNLPAGTEWAWIEGANHAQFGYYGTQLGDCSASISRESQQRELVDALSGFLTRVERNANALASLPGPN